MRHILLSLMVLLTWQFSKSQDRNWKEKRPIEFPDIPGYQTLKCDFHIHTVFSDGSVWPNIRVQEAIRDGLDAIAMTDHIEYQPHEDDIPHPDRNRSYQVAIEAASESDLIVINGSEITRDMPPGHGNAIFLQDANKLLQEDSIQAYREAKSQGAFIFWNHPNWTRQKPDGVAHLTELHKNLIKEGLLNGIEVVNDITYSEEALQIAIDNNLTIIGTSDIHGLVDWQYGVPDGGHRPVNLVFVNERSKSGIKEALENRRTLVWYNNILIGRQDYIIPLVKASLQLKSSKYIDETLVLSIVFKNVSDAEFILLNRSEYSFHKNSTVITIPPDQETEIQVKTLQMESKIDLIFDVLNAVTAPGTHPRITFSISVD